jgi:hypothetical protein
MKTRTKDQIAKTLLPKIRKRVRDFGIRLKRMHFVRGTARKLTCCAVGGALALRAKTRAELLKLGNETYRSYGKTRTKFVADLLGREYTDDDMFQLECGFENWDFVEFDGHSTNKRNPFYVIGKKLYADSLKEKP